MRFLSNFLEEWLPWWAPLLFLGFIAIAWIYVVVAARTNEDHETAYDGGSDAIQIGTLTIKIDADPGAVSDPDVQWGARVLRNALAERVSAGRPWLYYPYIRLLGIRKGSLYFDYGIFITVTGSVVIALKNYSALKKGLKDVLDDVDSIRRMASKAFRKLRRAEVGAIQLRLMTEEEWRASQGSHETFRLLAREVRDEESKR